MITLLTHIVQSVEVTQNELAKIQEDQAIKMLLLVLAIFMSLVLLAVFLKWYTRSKEYDSLTHAREVLRLHGRNLSDKQMKDVGYALQISSERNSKRGNNLCQSLARGFHRMGRNFYENNLDELSDQDIDTIIKYIHYWEWSKGKGKGIKLLLPEW